MKDRFARTGIAHRRRQRAQKHAIRGIVILQQRAIAAHPHFCRNVVALRFADEGMKQQSIDDLERALLNVFVRAVHRITSLESDDRLPAPPLELGTRFGRRQALGIMLLGSTQTGPPMSTSFRS